MKFLVKVRPLLVVLLLAISFLAFNHVIDLRSEEGRRALVSIEMLESGNWMVPHLNGEPYYNKPPAYNWVIAFFFALFGNFSEWVLRLPGALSLLASGGLVFLFARKYVHRDRALLLATAYLCSSDLLFYGSVNAGEIDLFYAFVVLLQVFSIFHFHQRKQWWLLFFSSYFFMAIGVLTKGLPSIAFQALTLVPYLIIQGDWKRLVGLPHIAGGLFSAGLMGGYFYLYSLENDVLAFTLNIFQQASQRTASEHTLVETLLGLLDFPGYLLGKMMPWGLLIIFLLWRPVRQQIASSESLRFLSLFVLCNIWIYWISPEMRSRYLFMFFPILTVLFVEAALVPSEATSRVWSIFRHVLFGALLIGSAACIVAPFVPVDLPVEVSMTMRVIIVLLGLMVLPLAFLFHRSPDRASALWTVVLVLALARFAFGFVALPLTQQGLKHHDYTHELIAEADGREINIFGQYRLTPKLSLFGTEFAKTQVDIPIELPYQVPYYYYLETGNVMRLESTRKEGQLYLSYHNQLIDGDVVLNRNKTIYPAVEMVLFTPNLP